jgi:hypothetical protein
VSPRAPAIGLILLAGAVRIAAADQTQQPIPPAPAAGDRLVFSADGAWLTGGSGGGGASALWSHTAGPQDVFSAGAEYQQVANAHWTNAVLSGSLGLGSGSPAAALYADAHEGAGYDGVHNFDYSVVTVGLFYTPAEWLTAQVEERRIDVDTSRGNLPKLGLAFRLAKPLLLSVSYADTAGGNLGTRLASLRLDYSGRAVNALAGAASGRAAPAVLNLLGQIVQPSPKLTELFAGAGRSFGRTDWQLLADYQDIEGFKRTTVTLLCTLHLEGRGRSP